MTEWIRFSDRRPPQDGKPFLTAHRHRKGMQGERWIYSVHAHEKDKGANLVSDPRGLISPIDCYELWSLIEEPTGETE